MIILVENDDDRIALGFINNFINKELEIHGDFIITKPIYEARIINIDDHN